jgi:uncharacterized protein (TIGR02466 family)
VKADLNHFFPTVIGSGVDTHIASMMLPVAKKFLSDEKYLTNEWGYKNTYSSGVGIEKFDEVLPFKNWLEKIGADYLTQLGYDSECIEFTYQIFFSEMRYGDRHGVHTHPNALLSGLIYLEIPEDSSSICFFDPRTFRNHVSIPVLNNQVENWSHVSFAPQNGLYLIWESWIPHEVPMNKSKDGRITMVFNLGKKNVC